MTIAYWCVLIAGLMHLPFTAIAKLQDGFKGLDNYEPRVYLSGRTGIYQRANWVQENSLEAFPFFAASVVIAHLVGSNQEYIDILAVSFVSLRVLYAFLYIANLAWYRTTAWYLSLICCIVMYFV